MKPLPENWILLKNDKEDFIFSNKERSHYVHIDYKEDQEEQFFIYFVQRQRDCMVIGTEVDIVEARSRTQFNAIEKAMLLMECINDHTLKQLKNLH